MSGGGVYPDLNEYLRTADLPPTAQFVNTPINTPLSIADLTANFPASAAMKGKYAQVSDLWGIPTFAVMRCGYNGRIYYWEPTTSTQVPTTMAIVSNVTVQPLTSTPIIQLTGSIGLGVTRNVTVGLDNAYPGATREIRSSLTSLLGNLNILGLGLGSGIAGLVTGSNKIACIDTGSALEWRQV